MPGAIPISFETLVEIVMAARELGKRRLELEIRRRIKDEYHVSLTFTSKPRVAIGWDKKISRQALAMMDSLDKDRLIGVCFLSWKFGFSSVKTIRRYMESKHGIRMTFIRETHPPADRSAPE